MDYEKKQKPLTQKGSSLRTLKNWIPKTHAERTRDNLELANMKNEMEATLSELSPDMQAEIRSMSNLSDPTEAERELIKYVVSEDHFKQQRKESQKGAFRDEETMKDRIYWIAFVPCLVALYYLYAWLSASPVRVGH